MRMGGPPQAQLGVGERSEQEASNKTQTVMEMQRFGLGLRPPRPLGLSLPTSLTPISGQADAFGDEC